MCDSAARTRFQEHEVLAAYARAVAARGEGLGDDGAPDARDGGMRTGAGARTKDGARAHHASPRPPEGRRGPCQNRHAERRAAAEAEDQAEALRSAARAAPRPANSKLSSLRRTCSRIAVMPQRRRSNQARVPSRRFRGVHAIACRASAAQTQLKHKQRGGAR